MLAEIETDKAVLELESFDEGMLQDIIVNAGDEEVAAGTVIAVLSKSSDEPAQAPATGNDPTSEIKRQFASPSRSEEHTSELQSLMRISYAVFCLKKKIK